MEKVIRLTEAEFTKLIKRIIKEQDLDDTEYRNKLQADYQNQTPPAASTTQPKKPSEPVSTPVSTQTAEIQKWLIALGFNVGPTGADGYMGPNTTKAIQEYQKSIGKMPSGKLDLDTYKRLQSDAKSGGNMSLNTPDVSTLQRYLNSWRPSNSGVEWPQLKTDGIRGPNTKKAIMAFQKDRGLPVNGYFDNATVAAIMKPFSGKGSTTQTPTTNQGNVKNGFTKPTPRFGQLY